MLRLIAGLFTCHHDRYTFPQTDRRTKYTTCCCLDCGKVLEYDWQQMKRGRAIVAAPKQITPARRVA